MLTRAPLVLQIPCGSANEPSRRGAYHLPSQFSKPYTLNPKPGFLLALQIPYGFANEPSRRGAYYLPSQFRSRSIPVMLVFHGFMGNGLGMVNTFKVRR